MAKLTHQQISDEVFSRGYELIDDSAYKSINSRIIIKCPHGHLIETTLADFRKVSLLTQAKFQLNKVIVLLRSIKQPKNLV